jgi:hypothetical protein
MGTALAMVLAVALGNPGPDCEAGDVDACRKAFHAAVDRAVTSLDVDGRMDQGLWRPAAMAAVHGCRAGEASLCPWQDAVEYEPRRHCDPGDRYDPGIWPIALPDGRWTWTQGPELGGEGVYAAGLRAITPVDDGVAMGFAESILLVGPDGVRRLDAPDDDEHCQVRVRPPYWVAYRERDGRPCGAGPKIAWDVRTGERFEVAGPVRGRRGRRARREGPLVEAFEAFEAFQERLGQPDWPRIRRHRGGDLWVHLHDLDEGYRRPGVTQAVALHDGSVVEVTAAGEVRRWQHRPDVVLGRWQVRPGVVGLYGHPDGTSVAVVHGKPQRLEVLSLGAPVDTTFPAWLRRQLPPRPSSSSSLRVLNAPVGIIPRLVDDRPLLQGLSSWSKGMDLSVAQRLPVRRDALSCVPIDGPRIDATTLLRPSTAWLERRGPWAVADARWLYEGGDPARPDATAESAWRLEDGDWIRHEPVWRTVRDEAGEPLPWVALAVDRDLVSADVHGRIRMWDGVPVTTACPPSATACASTVRQAGDDLIVAWPPSRAPFVPSTGIWDGTTGDRLVRAWIGTPRPTAGRRDLGRVGGVAWFADGPSLLLEGVRLRPATLHGGTHDAEVFTGGVLPVVGPDQPTVEERRSWFTSGGWLAGVRLERDRPTQAEILDEDGRHVLLWTYVGPRPCGEAHCAEVRQERAHLLGGVYEREVHTFVLEPATLRLHRSAVHRDQQPPGAAIP